MKSCRCGAIIATTLLATCALAPTAAAAGTVHTVELVGMEFVPADIVVELGDTVHWVWVSGFHNVESGVVVNGIGVPDGSFRSGDPMVEIGTTYELTFDRALLDAHAMPGDLYPYYCIVHAGVNMVGAVTVADCIGDADCDDGDICNGVETCHALECMPAAPPDCDDSNPCTTDSCEPVSGCLHIPDDNNACDDGEACTTDACISGVCVNVPLVDCLSCDTTDDCDDENPCTDERCRNGVCKYGSNFAPCDDGNACTAGDSCAQGVCAGLPIPDCCEVDTDCEAGACSIASCEAGTCMITTIEDCRLCRSTIDCEDGNVCTDDICDSGRCRSIHSTTSCSDENECTENDVCFEGVCAGTSIVGCCHEDDDCADDIPCTLDVCSNTVCSHTPIDDCGDAGDIGADDEQAEEVVGSDNVDDAGAGAPMPDNQDSVTPPPAGPRMCGAVGLIAPLGVFGGLGVIRNGRRRAR